MRGVDLRRVGWRRVWVGALALVSGVDLVGELTLGCSRALVGLGPPMRDALARRLLLLGFATLALAELVEVDDVTHGVRKVAPQSWAMLAISRCRACSPRAARDEPSSARPNPDQRLHRGAPW